MRLTARRNIMNMCSLVAGIIFCACLLMFSIPSVYSEAPSKNDTTLSTKNVERANPSNYPETITVVTENSGKPWWVEVLVTFASVTISALLIIWQIGRQYRNSIDLQQDNHRNQFKIKLYQELASFIDKATDKVRIGIVGLMLPGKIANSGSYTEIHERPLDISNGSSELVIEVTKLMCFLETYEVVMPRFRIFRLAFGCATDKLQKVTSEYFTMLLRFLPTDVKEEDAKRLGINVLPPVKPNNDELDKLREMGSQYFQECQDVYCYIHDLRIEAQKELLGNIFGNDVHGRIPIEEEYVVISTDKTKLAELENYFYENTGVWSFGRHHN
jgi:hypothetical protein